MKPENSNFDLFFDFVRFVKGNRFSFNPSLKESTGDLIDVYKKGNKIKIKKENRGKFTDYCGGEVTSECIKRGKNSSNPTIRKRAAFADNARKWKHLNGGALINRYNNFNNLFTSD